MCMYRVLVVTLLLAACPPRGQRDHAPRPRAHAGEQQLQITLEARSGQPISPRLFGTNLEPNTEVSPAVLAAARGFGLTTYRYPGGGSPGWRWATGVFDKSPAYSRCRLARIDELRRFLDKVKGEAIVQVNIETGTPQEAAALLRWMRDPRHPIRARYFEIGNEPYGDWDDAYRSAIDYARTVRTYAAALRAVDPEVKIGALLSGEGYDQDSSDDGVDTARWDEVVLKEAATEIDFISFHWYGGMRRVESALHVMGNSLKIPRIVARLRDLLAKHAPERQQAIEIGFLEWDGVFSDQHGLRHSLANAVFYADALMQMAASGVTLSNHYELNTQSFGLLVGYDACMRGVPGMKARFRRFDGARIRPKALTLQLVARMAGGRWLATRVKGNRTYRTTTHRPEIEHAGEVPFWAAYAARDRGGIKLLLLSRHPDAPVTAGIDLGAFHPRRRAQLLVLGGPSLDAGNETRAGTVAIRTSAIEVQRRFSHVIPPRSVSLIEIRER
jgi:alpha-L-arabinofuranosidase